MTGVPLVQPGVLEVVTDHVNSAWARKVGGILLGRPIDDVTRVDAALPARQTDEYAGEIAFPPPVWEEAYAKLDEHPGSTIVGWYLLFGLFLVPYRLLRRGARKRKSEALRHREMLGAIDKQRDQ